MSYDISHSKYLKGHLYISGRHLNDVLNEFADEIPEISFPHELEFTGFVPTSDSLIKIEDFKWEGEFSGSSYSTLLNILSKTVGWAHILLVWEDGDKMTGLRIRDGHVREVDVSIELED